MKILRSISEILKKVKGGVSKQDVIDIHNDLAPKVINVEFLNDNEAMLYIEKGDVRENKDILFIEESESLQQINVFCTFHYQESPTFKIVFDPLVGIGTVRQYRDIWQNDAPTTAIQTADWNIITDDIYQFDYFLLYYKTEASAGSLDVIPIYYQSELLKKPATTAIQLLGGARNGGSSGICRREIAIQLVNKKLVCTQAFSTSGSSTPTACIPIKLVGVR